jgi:predicted GIY-YIG superfamily endonuclease
MELKWTDRKKLDQDGVDAINKVAGVYRLMYYDTTKKEYYIYYVGQASDLNKRLSEHLSDTEKNACCKKRLKDYDCYFRAAAISKQSDRDGAEVALYNEYKPSCVEKVPDVESIEINFI